MYDHSLFLGTLSEFSAKLLTSYDIDAVLQDLMERLRDVLGLDGAGVALVQDGRLEFATAVPKFLAELEKTQLEHQSGPCMDAFRLGRVVAVTALQDERDRWPEYCAAAERLGMASVAGIPMRLTGDPFGAVSLYGAGPRKWPGEDIAAATVMADMATNYLINASQRRQQDQLNAQLQTALESQAIIEQAKGIIANHDGITVDLAFKRIRSHARDHNATVRSVVEAIVCLGMRI